MTAPQTPAPASPLPLAGVRVIALEQYGAGPFGSMYLADLGAEVIKIENPAAGGDVGRQVGPYAADGDSLFYQSFSCNKRSLALDLKKPGGMEIFHRLVADSDAVLDNLRGDLPEKLGITYDALKAVNPRIVCAHLSAYGRDGPRTAWPGYDYVLQAEAGYLSLTGEPDAPPSRFGLSIVDYMTGLTTAFALVSGVLGARATGQGRDLDCSLYDVAMNNLSYLAAWHLNEGYMPERVPRSGHPSLVPSELYRTQDGWLFIMCNKAKFWDQFADALGQPRWKTDPEMATYEARLRHRTTVNQRIDAVLQTQTTAAWMNHLAGVVPCAPVNDMAGALDNPFAADRAIVQDIPHPDRGTMRLVRQPVRVDGAVTPRQAAPVLGADTESVLASLGYDAEARRALADSGTIRLAAPIAAEAAE